MRNSIRQLSRAVAGVSILALAARAGAVVSGQTDTFSDGTTNGWGGGGASAVTSGGPAGAADPFLMVAANGFGGPASKLVTFNRMQWLGDYTTAGVNQISVDLKDFASSPMSIRIAFKDSTGQFAGGYSTTDAFTLPADAAWHHAIFSVSADAMTPVNSPAESFDSLIGPNNVLAEFRILDSASPSLQGDTIAANLGIDNVTAIGSGPAIASATWSAASGNWETGTNWIGGTPAYGAGQTATFPDPAGTAPVSATVTLTSSQIIGNLEFNASAGGSYLLAASGASTLTLTSSTASTIHLAAAAGNVTLTTPLVFSNDVTAKTDGNTILTIAGGVGGTGGLIKAGTGTVTIAAPATGADVTVFSLPSLSISSGMVALQSGASHADRTLLMLGNLSITAGQLDLGGNDAIIQGTDLTTVQALVKSGYNQGAWNGSGPAITSSLAADDPSHLTAVGVTSGFTSFDNHTVPSTDVLTKYTYYGDANLDGHVDGSDYSRTDNGLLAHSTGWSNGDFNYDGTVNGSDYTLIDNAFNSQGVSLAAQAALGSVEISAQIATSTSVPEPTGIAAILLGVGLLGRQRRTGRASPYFAR